MTPADRVLFDTPVLVDLLARRPKAMAQLRSLATQGARIAIASVSAAEIHSGMAEGEEQATMRLLDLFDLFPLNKEIAQLAGQLARVRRAVGRAYSIDDMTIAATAIKYNYRLYTTNKRDMEVPGLEFFVP